MHFGDFRAAFIQKKKNFIDTSYLLHELLIIYENLFYRTHYAYLTFITSAFRHKMLDFLVSFMMHDVCDIWQNERTYFLATEKLLLILRKHDPVNNIFKETNCSR